MGEPSDARRTEPPGDGDAPAVAGSRTHTTVAESERRRAAMHRRILAARQEQSRAAAAPDLSPDPDSV